MAWQDRLALMQCDFSSLICSTKREPHLSWLLALPRIDAFFLDQPDAIDIDTRVTVAAEGAKGLVASCSVQGEKRPIGGDAITGRFDVFDPHMLYPMLTDRTIRQREVMGRKRPHPPSGFIPHLAGDILDDPVLRKDSNDPFDMSRIHAPDIAR
jgi:hypothetical protein